MSGKKLLVLAATFNVADLVRPMILHSESGKIDVEIHYNLVSVLAVLFVFIEHL